MPEEEANDEEVALETTGEKAAGMTDPMGSEKDPTILPTEEVATDKAATISPLTEQPRKSLAITMAAAGSREATDGMIKRSQEISIVS